jgi:hypothetical protein
MNKILDTGTACTRAQTNLVHVAVEVAAAAAQIESARERARNVVHTVRDLPRNLVAQLLVGQQAVLRGKGGAQRGRPVALCPLGGAVKHHHRRDRQGPRGRHGRSQQAPDKKRHIF